MSDLFARGAWHLMNDRNTMIRLCVEMAAALERIKPISLAGSLHGTYLSRAQRTTHPRPLSLVDTIYAANSASELNNERAAFDAHAWLKETVEMHNAPDQELWQLQVITLGILYVSSVARASLSRHCPACVVETWIQTLPSRIDAALFGTHGDHGCPVLPSKSAAHMVVSEVIALKKAYESSTCV